MTISFFSLMGQLRIVISGLFYIATDGPNIFKHYCDSFFANIWAGLFSYNLLLLVLLFAPYYPFEGGRFWVCWCFNRGCSKVETLRFVYKLGIFYAAFLGLVGIVALSTMSINGTVYMLCGIWGGIQSYQLHKLHQMLHLMHGEENASSLDVKHPILNVCVPCDGKIPTADAVPAAGQGGGADGVPSATPVAQPAAQDAFGFGARAVAKIPVALMVFSRSGRTARAPFRHVLHGSLPFETRSIGVCLGEF